MVVAQALWVQAKVRCHCCGRCCCRGCTLGSLLLLLQPSGRIVLGTQTQFAEIGGNAADVVAAISVVAMRVVATILTAMSMMVVPMVLMLLVVMLLLVVLMMVLLVLVVALVRSRSGARSHTGSGSRTASAAASAAANCAVQRRKLVLELWALVMRHHLLLVRLRLSAKVLTRAPLVSRGDCRP